MSKEQIEEMCRLVCNACEFGCGFNGLCSEDYDYRKCNNARETALALFNAGYRKQIEGEWILTGAFKSTFPLPVADLHISCSVCGWKPPKYSDDYKEYNFCPNCGAKMKGGAE